MAGDGAGAWLTALLQRAKPVERCWVTGGDATKTEHVFAQRCICVFLAAWSQPCHYQLEVKKCIQAGLLLPAAAGKCGKGIPVLGASQATQAILCLDQMIIPPTVTPKIREELGASKDHGRRELEKTVWVIPAVSVNLVLILPIHRLTAGVSGTSSMRGAGVKNV